MNAEETPYDPVAHAVVRDPLGTVLPALVDRVAAVGNIRPSR
jgi:NAD-dependent deacetylase